MAADCSGNEEVKIGVGYKARSLFVIGASIIEFERRDCCA